MITGKRQRRLNVSVHDPITLGDLRWLLGQVGDLPDSASVSVKYSPGDRPFDASTSSITVSGELA